MCITGTVGQDGRNDGIDVKLIQRLLNLNGGRIGLPKNLSVDGACGPATIEAIRRWQSAADAPETGRLEPGDIGMKALRSTLPEGLTQDKLAGIMASASAALIERFFLPLTLSCGHFGIDSPLRMTHFLAQVGHESGDLRYQEELADGRAYEGRADLGNSEPGDGPRIKGRGLIQLTGRANYQRFGAALGRDLVNGDNPPAGGQRPAIGRRCRRLVLEKPRFERRRRCRRHRTVTRRINGGLNGLADRQAHLDRARWFLVR